MTAHVPRGGRALAWARRILAAVFAVSWLTFPGFGLPDLLVTWNPEWAQVLEAGWGLFMTVLVAAPFVAIASAPRLADVASTQLLVAAAALAVAAIVTAEWRLGVLVVMLVGESLIAAGLPRRPSLAAPAWTLLLVAAAGSPAWLVYALDVWRPERQHGADADYTLDIDHLSVQGAFAIAVASLAVLAAFWPQGRALIGMCAGISAAYFAVVSLAWPMSPAALSPAWSVACGIWGLSVAMLATVLRPRAVSRRGTARPRPPASGSGAPAS